MNKQGVAEFWGEVAKHSCLALFVPSGRETSLPHFVAPSEPRHPRPALSCGAIARHPLFEERGGGSSANASERQKEANASERQKGNDKK